MPKGRPPRIPQHPVKLQPQRFAAIQAKFQQAVAYHQRGDLDQAERLYREILAQAPAHFDALHLLGLVQHQRGHHAAAVELIGRAIKIDADNAVAYSNLGIVLRELKRPEEALASFDRALAIKPAYADVLNNRGNALRDLGRYEDAARSYARLVELAPDYDYAIGIMFHSQLHCCDWTQYAQNRERIVHAVSDGKKADAPFRFLAVSASAAAQLQCARVYVADKYPAVPTPLWNDPCYRHDKIRVAYLSADLREHAVAYLIAGLFEKHDRERFETIAISLRPEGTSTTGQRVKAAFDRFVDVSRTSDRDAAALMRELEVDIAVDLMGFTSDSRTGILARRPAPIQVKSIGFSGTMGADYIDYIIADKFVIPEEKRGYYAEHVVYLPDSFQPNDDRRKIAETMPTRLEAGLPESSFVFCSFNNSFKINPPVFDVWMRLLKAVSGSVLWLVADSSSVQNNLRREAEARGVEPARLIFAPRLPYADHLARLQLADLFLDTLPFNAAATASDALWAGVPVLTCAGEAFASRIAGSLLTAVGLPELITHSLDAYEALAFKLATTPRMLSELRGRLANNKTTYPLFDTDRFRRHIEAAYTTMWERYQRGEPPESFAVPAIGQGDGGGEGYRNG